MVLIFGANGGTMRLKLLFFKLNGSRIDHVGLYLGHSKFVHAPRKLMPLRTDTLNDSYRRRRFKGGRRVG